MVALYMKKPLKLYFGEHVSTVKFQAKLKSPEQQTATIYKTDQGYCIEHL